MNITTMMATAMNWPEPEIEKHQLNTNCALTGIPISEGYLVKDIVPDAMNDWLGTFSDINGYISVDAARCLKNDWNLGSRVFTASGRMFHPLINPANASEQQRPAWRDLIYEIANIEEEVAIIFTTDFKKRTWTGARTGFIGKHTPILVFDTKTNQNHVIMIDWQRLLEIHTIVHEYRKKGASTVKNGIAWPFSVSMFADFSLTKKFKLSGIADMERNIIPWRGSTELIFTLLIESYSFK